MTLRGLPFLVSNSVLYRDVFDLDRGIWKERVESGMYPLLVWVNDCGQKKVTRPSLEKQLEALKVKA